jgi:hypothetical protein
MFIPFVMARESEARLNERKRWSLGQHVRVRGNVRWEKTGLSIEQGTHELVQNLVCLGGRPLTARRVTDSRSIRTTLRMPKYNQVGQILPQHLKGHLFG